MLYCSEKNQTNTSGEQININGKIINSEETVKLLGVTLDYRLDFDPHIVGQVTPGSAVPLSFLCAYIAVLSLH